MKRGTKTFVLKPRRARLGQRRRQTLVLRVTVVGSDGAATRLRRTVRVRR